MKPEAQKSRSNGLKQPKRENVRPQGENAAEATKIGITGDLSKQLQDALSQIKNLQSQVTNLERRARYVTPEIEEAMKLYKATAKYETQCFEYVSRRVRSLTRYCGEEIENAIYASYRKDFGDAIDKVKSTIEREIIEKLSEENYW